MANSFTNQGFNPNNPPGQPMPGQAPSYDDKSAPPLTAPTNPGQFAGYGNVGFIGFSDPNNNFNINNQDPNLARPEFQDIPHLNEEEAKSALADYVSQHCCYGKGPVKDLTFTNLQSSNTYRYIIETFTESRSTQYVYEPYQGQVIINTGTPPPQPWDIPVSPVGMFQNQLIKVEIQNTSHVEMCTHCNGAGSKFCYSCHGRGTTNCGSCSGNGWRNNGNNERERCFSCSGCGHNTCYTCHGTGRCICSTCKGSGKLKWFLQLQCDFKNNVEDYIKKVEFIPDDLLRTCQSKMTYNEQNARIYPISHHQDPQVNEASHRLVSSHASKFAQCRILMQKHEVAVIPVTLCTYTWKDKVNTYLVYGLDNKVYCQDYPKKCCCTIL